MSFLDVLKSVWGLRWIVRAFLWLRRKVVENVKQEIQNDISVADNRATIVRIHRDFLAWKSRVADARAQLERDGPEAQQWLFYALNIEPFGATYVEIKAPPSIEEHLERLHSLGDFGRSVSKAMIISGDILAAEPNSPLEVEHQMDQLRKLDGMLQLGLKQLEELRGKELAEQL